MITLKECFENETIQQLMEFLGFNKEDQRIVLKYFMQRYSDIADVIQAIMEYYDIYYEFDEDGICGVMTALSAVGVG